MKSSIAIAGLAFLLTLNCWGNPLDTEKIKTLLGQMDNSFVQGHVYHLNYCVSQTRTDAFYDHNKALIKLMDEQMAKETPENASNGQNQDVSGRIKIMQDLKKCYLRKLRQARECNYTSDYSVDGTGFYLKQIFSFITCDGRKIEGAPAIYVSDGKIMGVFYPDTSQAVIQPATERPQVPTEYWTDIAFHFSGKAISEYCDQIQNLTISEGAGELVVEGDRLGQQKECLHLKLLIDKASLLPERLETTYRLESGMLDNKKVKTWEYQELFGMKWPKTVIEQEYLTDLSGRLNLESEQKLTFNSLSLSPKNSKEELAILLKSNFSVFDEIAGTHYVTGNPASALDNLSK